MLEETVKQFDFSGYKLPTKILWLTMIGGGVAAAGLAIYESLAFSATQIAATLVALVVTLLVNQYQLTVPQTKIKINAKELVVFWAIIWLGVPGAVLLAAASAAARFTLAQKDKKQWLFSVCVNAAAAFAAGKIFYLFLGHFAGFAGEALADNAVDLNYLLLAAGLATFAHYLFATTVSNVFLRLQRNFAPGESISGNFLSALGNYVVGVPAAFLFHFTFIKFGLSFGLVILPIAVAGHLGYRIFMQRLAQKTKEIREASRIHLATVEVLATAIDARDQVGIGHVRRTQIYAVGIGELLGLSDDDLQALNTGALLHDIGKLAVPDHILNKPTRLTPAEMEKTKIHAAVGASILENVNFPYPVVPTVKYHHEMWNGEGYPEKLKGTKIPLTARILTVADAYDALRGARPYRAAVSREEARKFLLNGAGTQFDPNIVDIFLRNLRRFEAEIAAQNLGYSFDNETAETLRHSIDADADQSYVEQIKRANREVYSLYELARVFGASLNLHDTLSLFVKKIGEIVPFDTCVVYLLENDSGSYAKAAYAVGKNSSALENKRIRTGEGATGFALKKREVVQNVEPGLDFTFHQIEIGEDYSTMISLPLFVEEKLLGAVSLYACELDKYEEEHLRLLETISRIASDAIGVALQHADTESKALTDPMTNLPNARSLQMQFEKEAARADRSGTNFNLLMLDLDGFKAVNDTYGHKTGDKMLREIAKVLRDQLRDYDFLARYAGDEFVILAPETEADQINELCRRIEKAVAEFELPVEGEKCARVGVSLGAACFPQHGATLDQVLISADKAMYARKSQRKRRQKGTLPASGNDVENNNLVVELDESHIISVAIN